MFNGLYAQMQNKFKMQVNEQESGGMRKARLRRAHSTLKGYRR